MSLPTQGTLNIIEKIDNEKKMKEDQKGILDLEQSHRAMVEQSLQSSTDLSRFENYLFNQLQADCEN